MILKNQEQYDRELYPDDDGLPMADNSLQYQWIVTVQGNLDALFRDDANVVVCGNMLWYAVEGEPTIRTAPDAMVIFGRPKIYRGSYMQWREEGIAPQVVFEILSPGNSAAEMDRKREFYDRHGVEEYYLYDPDNIVLSGWRRVDGGLQSIAPMHEWVSPRLGIRFDMSGEELVVYRPDGERFHTFLEVKALQERERQRAEEAELQAEEARRQAEQARHRADESRQQADEARQQADEARQLTEQAKLQAEQAKLQAEQARKRTEEAILQAEHDRRRTEESRQLTEQASRQAEEAKLQSEEARERTEDARRQAEQAQRQAEQALLRTQQAQHQTEQAQLRAERLAAQLRALGIEPET